MVIVTAGDRYLDIDAYASCVAYVKLLKSCGVDAIFASSAKPNVSVSELVRNYDDMLVSDYQFSENDRFVILDVSNPDFLDKIVKFDSIVEVIDHHTGFEDYWKDRKVDSQIEFIGSVATMIYEKIVSSGHVEILDSKMCKLLTAAILDNTLNLKSTITTKRDKEAYETLKVIGNIEPEFDETYFKNCQEDVNKDVVSAIKTDIKHEYVADILPTVFGQLTVYDIEPIFAAYEDIEKLFEEYKKPWLLNVICIKDGKSYVVSSDKQAQHNLSKLFSAEFKDDVLVLDKFLLRKQIMKQARLYVESPEKKNIKI